MSGLPPVALSVDAVHEMLPVAVVMMDAAEIVVVDTEKFADVMATDSKGTLALPIGPAMLTLPT